MSFAEKLSDMLTQAAEGQSTAFQVVRELDTEGKPIARLVIERRTMLGEQQEKDAVRGESQARCHRFQHSSSLVDYLNRYGTKDTVVFVDLSGRMAKAVINESAEKGKEILSMSPMTHPRWLPWREMLGQALDVRDFVTFLRENRKAIIDPNPRTLLQTMSQIRSSTTIEQHIGEGASSLNGLLVRTNIRGDESNDIVDLPERLTVRAPVFVGCAERDIEIDLVLGASPNGTGVIARLSSADIRTAEIEAFEAMTDELREGLAGEDVPEDKRMVVTLGAPGETDWDYL